MQGHLTKDQIEFRNPKDAFDDAIKSGRLSDIPSHPRYAGHYMYMGSSADGLYDSFKHIVTREYLKAVI